MSPAERLAALGLTLPPVTVPVAAYVPAVRTGAYVYVSGQLPVTDGKLPATGKVGDAVSAQDAVGLARTCALNALAAAAEAASAFSAQVRARPAASWALTESPTLPVAGSFPSVTGSWPETYTYAPVRTAGT